MSEALMCSFCGKSKNDVIYLVKSPYGPCICESCAADAVSLIMGRMLERSIADGPETGDDQNPLQQESPNWYCM